MTQILIPLMKCLLASYIVTALLLMLLALLLYKLRLSEQIVSIAIIVIYILATFLAGFLAGKCMQTRKYLWGLTLGLTYFLIIAAISIAINHSSDLLNTHFITTLILCTASGMLGGMLS